MEGLGNKIKRLKKKLDENFTPMNLAKGDPQLYVQLCSSLDGMVPSVACRRLIRFARPIFWTTMVLSLLSIFGSEHVQDVIVAAVMGSISITFIKLIIYLNILIVGLSLAINQRDLSSAFQIIATAVSNSTCNT